MDDFTKHLLDIKMAQAKTQEQILAMRRELQDHNEATKKTRAEVDAVKEEVVEIKAQVREARASLKTANWMAGVVVAVAIGVVSWALKIFKLFT